MAEQRCPCGFLRSVVPCPVCDGGLSPNARTRENVSELQTLAAPRRKRGDGGESHGLDGAYRCSSCGIEKPLSEFYIDRSRVHGHQSRCRACDNNKRVQRLNRSKAYV